jgi:PAS domain-containing protein
MAQKEVEMILLRQLASYLATPVFLVDTAGTLVFYNEAAEHLLGTRFEDTGEMPAAEWGTIFSPTDEQGKPVPAESLPLAIAVRERRGAQRALRIKGLDGVPRMIEVTAVPLIGQASRQIGAIAFFQGKDAS